MMKVTELYARPDCEVSLGVLRKRLTMGEPYDVARRLRNFVVLGKRYASLWDLAKDLKGLLTYQQLRHRVGTLKLTPTEAVKFIYAWVENRKHPGPLSRVARDQLILSNWTPGSRKPNSDK